MDEKRVALTDLSDIAWDYLLVTVDVGVGPRPARILVVEFAGSYRDGHKGKPDARLMISVITAGLWAWEADALVPDLSGLSYEWGEEMVEVLTMGNSPPWSFRSLETVAVTSRQNEAALRGLVDEILGEEPRALLVSSRKEALDKLTKRIRKRWSAPPG